MEAANGFIAQLFLLRQKAAEGGEPEAFSKIKNSVMEPALCRGVEKGVTLELKLVGRGQR